MSIDLTYHAFSPSLADKNWEHFPEDILLVRKKRQTEKKFETELAVRPETIEYEAQTAKYDAALAEKRKEIFKRYEDEGLFIPEIDWQMEGSVKENGAWRHYPANEDKMDYLMNWGPMFPKGYNKGGTIPGKFMYEDDKAEYNALERKKNKYQDAQLKKMLEAREVGNPPKIELTERQDRLWMSGIDYLTESVNYDKTELIQALKRADLQYGSSIEPDYPESPAQYDPVLEVFGLERYLNEEERYLGTELVTDKKIWFDLYSSLNSEVIHSHAIKLNVQTDWGLEDCEEIIKEFFLAIKPLIKFLKDTPDAIFLRDIGGIREFDPKSADKIFVERAEKNAEKYKGLIPPVL